jgi:hypothetical protein
MKTENFKYVKKGATEPKEYSLVVLKEDSDSLEGISFLDLSPEHQGMVQILVQYYEPLLESVPESERANNPVFLEYCELLKPYMRNYRKFLKSSIIREDLK